MSSSKAGRVTSVVVVTAGLAFLVAAVVRTWDTFTEALSVDPWRWSAAAVLGGLGLLLLAWSWALVHPRGSSRGALVRGFLLAQPGKYVPGGVAMPVGQVALSRVHDTSTGASTARFVLHSLMMVAGGGWVTAMATFAGPRRWLGWVAVAVASLGSAALVSIDTDSVVRLVVRVARRVVPRLSRSQDRPVVRMELSAGERAVALVVTVGAMGVLATPFPLVLEAGVATAPAAMAAFSFAWAVGFLLVPLPAGAGAREAALAFALAPLTGLGTLVAASLLQRAAMLAAEAVVAGGALVGNRWGRGAAERRSNMRSG